MRTTSGGSRVIYSSRALSVRLTALIDVGSSAVCVVAGINSMSRRWIALIDVGLPSAVEVPTPAVIH
jgi:hypothetical protein